MSCQAATLESLRCSGHSASLVIAKSRRSLATVTGPVTNRRGWGVAMSHSQIKRQMGSETSVSSLCSDRQEKGLRGSIYSRAASSASLWIALNRPLHSAQTWEGLGASRETANGDWTVMSVSLGPLEFPWRSQVRKRGPWVICYKYIVHILAEKQHPHILKCEHTNENAEDQFTVWEVQGRYPHFDTHGDIL